MQTKQYFHHQDHFQLEFQYSESQNMNTRNPADSIENEDILKNVIASTFVFAPRQINFQMYDDPSMGLDNVFYMNQSENQRNNQQQQDLDFKLSHRYIEIPLPQPFDHNDDKFQVQTFEMQLNIDNICQKLFKNCNDELEQKDQDSTVEITQNKKQPSPARSSDELEKNIQKNTFCKETRKDKVQRYIEKRKNRNWNRKISYDCRKRVADSRLRLKGRFITQDQVQKLLKCQIESLSMDQIKTLLQMHISKQ